MRPLIALVLSALLAACGGQSDDPVASPMCSGLTGTNPTLATNQLLFDSDRANNRHEIYVMKTDGSCVFRLTNNAAYENWWPRASPDRSKILFYRSPTGDPENYVNASLWVMNADGSGQTPLIGATPATRPAGWLAHGHGEWSPDGRKIAMFGALSNTRAEIFVTDASGQNPVQYTNRNGWNTDVSWSPNGATLLFNGCANPAVCAPANYEIFAMPATPLAAATQITNDTRADYDAYFSPSGNTIAWLINVDPTANVIPNTTTALGSWAIGMVDINSSGTLSNPRFLINDGNINSKPAWSLDGQTIFFHRMVPPDYRFRVFKINPNGTGLLELTAGATGNSEHPSH
jgi:Tol biopolymer transport system component